MKSRPILFSAPMVRALLAGTKKQTRRTFKGFTPPEDWLLDGARASTDMESTRCPFGVIGDQLWVKEALTQSVRLLGLPRFSHADFAADGVPTLADAWPWKRSVLPGMFMPRGLSRITLEITDVRVQRLQDISEEDALAEGVEPATWGADAMAGLGAVLAYSKLWDDINGEGAWTKNPWVWALSFKRVAP